MAALKQSVTKITLCVFVFAFVFVTNAVAQIGEYRNVWTVGAHAGYAMNTVGFQPTVQQDMKGGISLGAVARYTSEKYFSTICAIQGELNITSAGWKERIETLSGEQVINPETGVAEAYERSATYVQIPVLAHLAWGKETEGLRAFVVAGPQVGFLIGQGVTKNYDTPFISTNFPSESSDKARVSSVVYQEDNDIENKIDYGIALGAGVEYHIKNVGRFQIEGRYYYGLGNLYGNSKKDYFGKSNNGIIHVRLAYLIDLKK